MLTLDYILDMYRDNKILKEDVKIFVEAKIIRTLRELKEENKKEQCKIH